jgi:prepilin-type N-terminal cleavage/methylation domain-containing protein
MFELLLKVGDDGPKKQMRNGSWFSRSAFVRHSSSGGTNQRAEGTIQMENKQDKGFTLVELLIVIVILGILATVTVFAVRGITDQGQTSACSADQKTLETAAETWFAQYGGTAIPGTITATKTTPPVAITATTAEGALVQAGFLVQESTNYTMTADGSLTVQNSKCPAVA